MAGYVSTCILKRMRHINAEQNRIVLALVFLGARLPKYFQRSLVYLRKEFPENRIILAADSQKSLLFAKKRGIETFELDWESLRNNLPERILNVSFRDNYWSKVNARLFALPQISELLMPGETLLHLEGDMLLLRGALDFPLDPNKGAFWMTLDSHADMPGLIFLRSESAAWFQSQLCKQKTSLGLSDMATLQQIRLQNPTRVGVLPSLENLDEFSDSTQRVMFDAAQLGQWFFGEDPRNAYGFIRRRRKLRNGIDMSGLRIEESEGQLLLCGEGKSVRILSIHVHSKQLKLFSFGSSARRLAKSAQKHHDSFSIRGFVTVLVDYVKAAFRLVTRARMRREGTIG